MIDARAVLLKKRINESNDNWLKDKKRKKGKQFSFKKCLNTGAKISVEELGNILDE